MDASLSIEQNSIGNGGVVQHCARMFMAGRAVKMDEYANPHRIEL